MSIPMNKSFTIDEKICSTTEKPFGSKYAGTFSVRRPSLLDKIIIAVKDAARMSIAGEIAPGTLGDRPATISYIYSFMTTVNTEPLPEWFDLSAMYEDEDEDAMFAVWSEVSGFLSTFRPKAIGEDGGAGKQKPPVLVSSEI